MEHQRTVNKLGLGSRPESRQRPGNLMPVNEYQTSLVQSSSLTLPESFIQNSRDAGKSLKLIEHNNYRVSKPHTQVTYCSIVLSFF